MPVSALALAGYVAFHQAQAAWKLAVAVLAMALAMLKIGAATAAAADAAACRSAGTVLEVAGIPLFRRPSADRPGP